VNGEETTETDDTFDDADKNIHIVGCDNTVVGSDVLITGDGNDVEDNTIGAGEVVTIQGSDNVVTGNEAATFIKLVGAYSNIVSNNVAAGTFIELSSDEGGAVSDNVIESNTADYFDIEQNVTANVVIGNMMVSSDFFLSQGVVGTYSVLLARYHRRCSRAARD
jgi:hypothetical protein